MEMKTYLINYIDEEKKPKHTQLQAVSCGMAIKEGKKFGEITCISWLTSTLEAVVMHVPGTNLFKFRFLGEGK